MSRVSVSFCVTILVVIVSFTGNGVTANMPALGAGDSGFESRFPD